MTVETSLEANKSETIVTSPNNNNLISPKDLSKSQDLNPANSRMGRRKQVAPQKAAGTDGRTQLFDMHFCLFALRQAVLRSLIVVHVPKF